MPNTEITLFLHCPLARAIDCQGSAGVRRSVAATSRRNRSGKALAGLKKNALRHLKPYNPTVGARGVVHTLQFNGKQEEVKAIRDRVNPSSRGAATFNLRCPRNGKTDECPIEIHS